MHIVVGLGNPGAEYENTRHNVGRTALVHFASAHNFSPWEFKKKCNALVSEGVIGTGKKKQEVTLILPETFMNKSGTAVKHFVPSKKKAESLIVVHDEMDMPRGVIKLSYGRGAGGHHGVESVIRAVGTKDFTRIRIGVSEPAKKGAVKKPKGEKKVLDFLIKGMQKGELAAFSKIDSTVAEALETLLIEGRAVAMNKHN